MSALQTGHKKSVVIAKPTELKPPLDLVGSEAGGFSGIPPLRDPGWFYQST